jgi:uncharacterized protein GlcG (DUF336 family)
MTRRIALSLAALLLVSAAVASAQLVDRKALSLDAAKKMAAAAAAEAKKNNWLMVVAVVDDGGHLLYLERPENTQTGSIRIAIDKARSAAAFKRPTKVWEDALAGGRSAILGLRGAVPSEGGVPVVVDGRVLGAVGVSGGSAQQDGQVAKAGADALASK